MSRAAIYMEFDGRGFVPADAWAQEQLSAREMLRLKSN